MRQKLSTALVVLLGSTAGSCTKTHYIGTDRFRPTSGVENSERAIVSSTHKNRSQGAIEGAGIGLLSGTLLGIAVAASPGECEPGDDRCLSSGSFGERFAFFGTGMMLSGALIGSVVGAIRGHRDVYKQSKWTWAASPRGAQIGTRF